MIDNLTDLYTYYNILNYILNYGIDAQFDEQIYPLFAEKNRAADVKNVYNIIREPYRLANNKKVKVSKSRNSKREIDAVIDYENNDRWTNYMYTWYGASKMKSDEEDVNNGRIDTYSLYESALDMLLNSDSEYRYSEDDIIPGIAEEVIEDNSNINKISTFVKECFNKGIFEYCDGSIKLCHNIFDEFNENNLIDEVYSIADIFSNIASLSPIGYFLKRNIKMYLNNIENSDTYLEDTSKKSINKQSEDINESNNTKSNSYNKLNTNYIYIKGNSMYYSFCNELIYRALYAAAKKRYVVIRGMNYIVDKIYLKSDGMFGTGEYPYLKAYNQKTGLSEDIALDEEYLEVGDKIKEDISIYKPDMNTKDLISNNNQYDIEDNIITDTVAFYINQRECELDEVNNIRCNKSHYHTKDYIQERIDRSAYKCIVSHNEETVERYDVYKGRNMIYDKAIYNVEYKASLKNDFIKWVNSFGNYAEYKADSVYIFDESEKRISVNKRENSNFDKSLFEPWNSIYLDEYKKRHNMFIPSVTELFWLKNILNRYRHICKIFVEENRLNKIESILLEYISRHRCDYDDRFKEEEVFNPFTCGSLVALKTDTENDCDIVALQIDEKIELSESDIAIMHKITEWIKNKNIIEYEYKDYYGNYISGVIYPYRMEIDLLNQKNGLMAYDLINEKNVYILINRIGTFENVRRYNNISEYYDSRKYNADERFLKEIFYFNNMFCRSDECDRVIGLLSLFKTWDYERDTGSNEINLSHSLVKRDASKFKNDYYNILSNVRKATLAIQNSEEVPIAILCETYEQIMNSGRYNDCENIDFFRTEIQQKYGYYYNYVIKNIPYEDGYISRYDIQKKDYIQFDITPAEIRYMTTTLKMYQYIYEYLIGYTDSNKKISQKKKDRCHEILVSRYSDVLREEIIYRSETLKLMKASIRIKKRLSIALANKIRNDLREFAVRILPDKTELTFIVEITYESYKYRKIHMIILSWGDNVEVIEPEGLKKVIEQRKK